MAEREDCGFCMRDLTCTAASQCNTTWSDSACPVVAAVDPETLDPEGGIEISLTGELFIDDDGLECGFDGVVSDVALVWISEEEVVCTAPAGEAGSQTEVALFLRGEPFTVGSGQVRLCAARVWPVCDEHVCDDCLIAKGTGLADHALAWSFYRC